MPSHLSVPDITLREFQEPTFGVPYSPAGSDNADADGITSAPALENGISRSGQVAILQLHDLDMPMLEPNSQPDRPFRCHQCPQSFNRNHDLIRHERVHESKAFSCEFCDKSFAREEALKVRSRQTDIYHIHNVKPETNCPLSVTCARRAAADYTQ
jgi:hypothetical protein